MPINLSTFAAHSPHCAGLLTAAVQMVSHFFGPCCVFICLCAAASFGFCRLTERIIKIGTYFWSQCGVVGPAFVVVIVTVAAAVRISLLHMCVYLYLVQFGSFIFAIFRILLNAHMCMRGYSAGYLCINYGNRNALTVSWPASAKCVRISAKKKRERGQKIKES